MKHLLPILAVAGLLFSFTGKNENIISGTLDGLKAGDKIYLATGTITQVPTLRDSAKVTKDGYFTLRTTATDTYTTIYVVKKGESLNLKKQERISLFLEGFAKISIKGDVNYLSYVKTKGGLYDMPEMAKILSIIDSSKVVQKKGFDLFAAADKYSKSENANPDSIKIMRDSAIFYLHTADSISNMKDSLNTAFIKANPNVAYSAELLHFDHATMKNFDQYEKTFFALSPRVQNSLAGIPVKNHIDATNSTKIGAIAPDFTAVDINGDSLSLSSLRGKYVLIDFWGTWCGPCRASLPSLRDLNNKVKGEHFAMISIATNEGNEAFWRKTVTDEKMDWLHINDSNSPAGKEIKNTYAVMGVPTCFFIDPHGVIIAKGHPDYILSKVEKVLTEEK